MYFNYEETNKQMRQSTYIYLSEINFSESQNKRGQSFYPEAKENRMT